LFVSEPRMAFLQLLAHKVEFSSQRSDLVTTFYFNALLPLTLRHFFDAANQLVNRPCYAAPHQNQDQEREKNDQHNRRHQNPVAPALDGGEGSVSLTGEHERS
jgi:hypothetical protein